MTGFRGIPEPTPDPEGMLQCLIALKEAVETDAQGLRSRQIGQANRERALVSQRAVRRTQTLDSSLAELRTIVAAIQVDIESIQADITALDARVTQNETDIADHETRITALEQS